MRDVAVEFTVVVGDDVLRCGLMLSVEGQEVVRKILGPSDEQAVVIDCIGMVRGQQEFPIHSVDSPAVPHDAVVDRLTIQEFAYLLL
jgi:hypothetical protein